MQFKERKAIYKQIAEYMYEQILAGTWSNDQMIPSISDMAVQMALLGEVEAARHYSARASEANVQERHADYTIRNLALSCLSQKAISREEIDAIGTLNPGRPISSVTILVSFVRLLQDDACSDFDREYFADRMAEIFLTEGYETRASANVYSALAVLENALQRYENAYHYIEQFLSLEPDNTRGLLMKLHFTTALQKLDERQGVIDRLQAMEEEGKLTVGEQQTLALYLEPD